MDHIPLKNRNQYEFTSLEDLIEKDNVVRFVDALADKLELNKLTFTLKTLKKNLFMILNFQPFLQRKKR